MSIDVDLLYYLHHDNQLNIQFDLMKQKVNFGLQMDANISIESDGKEKYFVKKKFIKEISALTDLFFM